MTRFASPLGIAVRLVVVCITAISAVGCGGGYKLGQVSGRVTLGGQPVADALVVFSPANGSPSAGRTDSNGNYTLVYARGPKRRDITGAEIGQHTVTITTYQPAMEDPPTPEKPERIPLRYREGPDLPKVEVKPGNNTFDFHLEPGPVEPPAAKGKVKRKSGPVPCY